MNEGSQLASAMLAVAFAGVMLVAGQSGLRPSQPRKTSTKPASSAMPRWPSPKRRSPSKEATKSYTESPLSRALTSPQIFRRFLAAVRDDIERHLGAIRQAVQAGLLDGRDMDEHVLAAGVRRDEPSRTR